MAVLSRAVLMFTTWLPNTVLHTYLVSRFVSVLMPLFRLPILIIVKHWKRPPSNAWNACQRHRFKFSVVTVARDEQNTKKKKIKTAKQNKNHQLLSILIYHCIIIIEATLILRCENLHTIWQQQQKKCSTIWLKKNRQTRLKMFGWVCWN